MTFDQFLTMLDRDRAATLPASLVATVKPPPWFHRRGNGKDSRIGIWLPGGHGYERQPGADVWVRVEGRSDFDVLDDAA